MVKQRRNLVAGYGINSWLQQRITAVIMLVAIVAVVAFVVLAHSVVGPAFGSWQHLFSFTFVKIFTQLVVIAVLIHAWVGIRDLWMDYIQCAGVRLLLYTLTALWLVGSLIYSIQVMWA